MNFSCLHNPKSVKYTLDGGKDTGQYSVELCQDCDSKSNFKFVVKQENLKYSIQELGGDQNNISAVMS